MINALIVPFHYFTPQVGVEVAHPGVENDFNDESAKKYYTYYQWVCFVLFFQVRSEVVSLDPRALIELNQPN